MGQRSALGGGASVWYLYPLQTYWWEENITKSSSQSIFNFDADPGPGSALEKMDPDPCYEHFF